VSYAVTSFCSGPSVVHFWKHCPASACRYMSSRPRTARRCPVCAEVAYATAPLAAQGHRRAAAALAAQHRRAALLCAGFEGWHAAVAEPRRRALAAWAHARYAAAFAAWCRCSPRSQLPAANSFAPVLSYCRLCTALSCQQRWTCRLHWPQPQRAGRVPKSIFQAFAGCMQPWTAHAGLSWHPKQLPQQQAASAGTCMPRSGAATAPAVCMRPLRHAGHRRQPRSCPEL